MEQLTELLTWYGKVDEVWFDGANGEGPDGRRQVYDWQAYYDLIRKLQPDAVTAVMGEDVRWVGTESGYGRETEWSATVLAPGGTPESVAINEALGVNAMSEDLGSSSLLNKAGASILVPGRGGCLNQAGMVLACIRRLTCKGCCKTGRHLSQFSGPQCSAAA